MSKRMMSEAWLAETAATIGAAVLSAGGSRKAALAAARAFLRERCGERNFSSSAGYDALAGGEVFTSWLGESRSTVKAEVA